MRSTSPLTGPIAAAMLAIGILAVIPAPAGAASPLCQRLEARLAALTDDSSREPAMARRYRVAIGEQKRQMRIAQRRARQMGCDGSVVRLQRDEAGRCAVITGSIRSMRANLAKLERQLQGAGRGSLAAERRRILAGIRANRCREAPKQRVVRRLPDSIATARRDFELRKRLFEPREDGGNSSVTVLEPGLSGSFDGGTYRTLCVRTCDGYYFPMSFSTTPEFFYRDQDACQAMCPGVDVRLYAHRSGIEEPEDMVSLSGEPYTALPAAFAYRDPGFKRPGGCACKPAKNYAVIGGGETRQEPEADTPAMPVPRPRPDPAADPETAANAAGGLTEESLRSLLGKETGTNDDETKRRIRVVGPTFLPDPEEAIDLKAPGRNAVR